MVRVLKRCGRLLPGLVLLCLSIPAQAQSETDTDPQAAESSVDQPSVYETLMFDRPYAVGAESESARQRRRAVETKTCRISYPKPHPNVRGKDREMGHAQDASYIHSRTYRP